MLDAMKWRSCFSTERPLWSCWGRTCTLVPTRGPRKKGSRSCTSRVSCLLGVVRRLVAGWRRTGTGGVRSLALFSRGRKNRRRLFWGFPVSRLSRLNVQGSRVCGPYKTTRREGKTLTRTCRSLRPRVNPGSVTHPSPRGLRQLCQKQFAEQILFSKI